MNRRERRAIVKRYGNNPQLFAREILGVELWSKQAAVALSVRDHPRTAVRSCHGVGKTFLAAVIILWFLYLNPRSRVVTTAPIYDQVKLLLWAEIRALHDRATVPLGGSPNVTSLHLAPDWFAVGLSTNQPTRFQGHHAEKMLLVCDEASGIPDEIFEAAEGFLTGDFARVLLIGNPNQASGQFYDAFSRQAKRWNRHHISAFDSPNFTKDAVAEYPELAAYMEEQGIPYSTEKVDHKTKRKLVSVAWVADKLEAWGTDHLAWLVRVLGKFPTTAVDTVFGLQEVQDAQAREAPHLDPDDVVCVACDVARYGDDETVIGLRAGLAYRQRKVYGHQDTVYTAEQIISVCEEWDAANPDYPVQYVIVDDSGVGGGVVDQLKAADFDKQVVAFNGAHKPQRPKKYPNARSESWFTAKAWIREVSLDPDPQLLGDLVAPKWKPDNKLRRVVEKKEQTKKRLKRSPDRADTFLMAYYPAKDLTAVHTPGSMYQ